MKSLIFACKDKKILEFKGGIWSILGIDGGYRQLMTKRRTQSTILHIIATMLLCCGFVKAAEQFDPLNAAPGVVASEPDELGPKANLPCGNNRH
jgi:hypothetical protein